MRLHELCHMQEVFENGDDSMFVIGEHLNILLRNQSLWRSSGLPDYNTGRCTIILESYLHCRLAHTAR